MTEFLYVAFYVWLVGVVITALLYFAAIKIIGGRQEFSELLEKFQGKRYSISHIDWAIVIGVVFWPSTVATIILNRAVSRSQLESRNDG